MRIYKVKHAKQLHHTRIPARILLQRCDNCGVVRLKQDMVVLKVPTEDQGGKNNRCQFFWSNGNIGPRRRPFNLKPQFTPHCTATPASGRIRLHCNGREQLPTAASKPRPFHPSINLTHHQISERAFLFSRTWKCNSFGIADKSINRRTNIRPGLTTVAAWCNRPASDNSSRFVQARLYDHSLSSSQRRHSIFLGKRKQPSIVSISMPRNVMQQAGHSILCSLPERPNFCTMPMRDPGCWHIPLSLARRIRENRLNNDGALKTRPHRTSPTIRHPPLREDLRRRAQPERQSGIQANSPVPPHSQQMPVVAMYRYHFIGTL